MSEFPPADLPIVAVGRYARISHAHERGLVISAMDQPYWVIREGREFVLYVDARVGEYVAAELASYEAESAERGRLVSRPLPVLPKLDTLSLFLGGWAMSMYWTAQNFVNPARANFGAARNDEILSGEWWRVITALTLHGDFSHFAANLFFGLLFAAFLQPRIGGGVAWLLIVISGALGNAINAWFYQSELHITIGASTAVFGALGALVVWEFVFRARHPGLRNWWQLIVPLGGGIALLAFLGVGDEASHRTDYMAHFWGFCAGVMIGTLIAPFPRAPRIVQRISAWAAIAIPVVCWYLAWRSAPLAPISSTLF